MELKLSLQKAVENIISALDERDIEYVVLRKYGSLPDKVVDEDIDLQVHNDDFEQALEICRSQGFENKHSTLYNVTDLIKRAINKPDEALYWIRNQPRELADLVLDSGSPYSKGASGYRSIKLTRSELMLDIKNHLAYRSPMNGERIRVDPFVERKLYERRQKYGKLYVPSPPDELAHVICHCVFDKEGTFSPYYQNRCDELIEEVREDEQFVNQYETLLEYLFFDAAELVATVVYEGRYNELLSELYSFDEY